MRIGILSDSHDRHEMVRSAMAIFDRCGVTMIVHCGDVGGVGVFDELVGRRCRFVWGNCDTPDHGIMTYLEAVGIPSPTSVPLRFDIDGKRFCVFHGHEARIGRMDHLDADYVLHGHTHCRRDERIGTTRIINPGALYRAHPTTVAVLDPRVDELTFHEVRKSDVAT